MKSWFAPEQPRCEHGRGGHEYEQRQPNAVLLLQRYFRLYHVHGSEQYDNEAYDHDEQDTQVRLHAATLSRRSRPLQDMHCLAWSVASAEAQS